MVSRRNQLRSPSSQLVLRYCIYKSGIEIALISIISRHIISDMRRFMEQPE